MPRKVKVTNVNDGNVSAIDESGNQVSGHTNEETKVKSGETVKINEDGNVLKQMWS